MKKQIYLTLILLSSFLSLKAQQIGDGWAPVISNFGDILNSGVYNGIGALGSVPDMTYSGWQHILVIRHPNSTNNHQFQLGTSFSENDRLFFRKIAGAMTPRSPGWIELATRGSNTFLGDQTITGNLGIGTISPAYKLDVNGTIRAKEIKVESGWADFVFNDNYKLRSLAEVGLFINEHKHLPNIPSAKEVEESGVNLGEMDALLLQKIEELTLYTIEQNKKIQVLEEKLKKIELAHK